MAIINGYLENLLDDDMIEDPEMARRFLTIMRKHADRISRIVEDMLVISRLESGEANALKIEPFRFRSCIKDILERLESVIRSQNAEITVIMPDREPRPPRRPLLLDPGALQPRRKRPQTKPPPRPAGRNRLRAGRRQPSASGSPTTASASPAPICRTFSAASIGWKNTTRSSEIKGTGLGLSIVKRAIEAHGGTISVTSVPGRETKFLITVPKSLG